MPVGSVGSGHSAEPNHTSVIVPVPPFASNFTVYVVAS